METMNKAKERAKTMRCPSGDALQRIKLLSSSRFVDIDVYGILRQESPDEHGFRLPKTPETTDGLSLVRQVNLLCRCKQWRKKDGMIGGRQVRARSTLVHHVQQEHALLTVVLELL